jgi:hypothetical protein
LRKLLFYEELDVLGDIPFGRQLADHAPGPPVEQPLGAHTDANGSGATAELASVEPCS